LCVAQAETGPFFAEKIYFSFDKVMVD